MEDNKQDNVIEAGKELHTYGDNRYNYSAPREIMVTITIDEYRHLVECNARHKQEMEELREDYGKRIEKLTNDVDFFKAQSERLAEELKITPECAKD